MSEEDKVQFKSYLTRRTVKVGHSIADEELNEDLILHSWNLVKSQVQRVIEYNKSQGVPNPEAYIGYVYADGTPEPMSIKQKRKFLNTITYKKGGKPITVDGLVVSGRIFRYRT